MMRKDPRAEIIQNNMKELDDNYILKTKNNIWKERSKGVADWVVVQDFDEFIYHPDMRNYLEQLKKDSYTIVQCDGWDVSGDEIPTSLEGLRGVRNNRTAQIHGMDKSLIFNPNAVEINYGVGAHYARPTGIPPHRVKISVGVIKLLHLKMGCGLDYFLWRRATTVPKLSVLNIQQNWGCECLRPEDKQIAEFEELKRKAVPIV